MRAEFEAEEKAEELADMERITIESQSLPWRKTTSPSRGSNSNGEASSPFRGSKGEASVQVVQEVSVLTVESSHSRVEHDVPSVEAVQAVQRRWLESREEPEPEPSPPPG